MGLREQYLNESGLNSGIKGAVTNFILSRIRNWDFVTAQQVDHFIANSHYIKNRIRCAYGKEATVIYPPVDINGFQISGKKDNSYLAVSRMVPYKKMDLIVEAFSELGSRLIVIGDGPDFEKVKSKAKKNIEFLGHQKSNALKEYMQKARAFIFTAEEDFGIVPVEAQACGTPVIAFGKGGVTETVIPIQNRKKTTTLNPPLVRGELKGGLFSYDREHNTDNLASTGIFFHEQTTASLIDAVKKFETLEDKFDPHKIRKNAERFGIERFRKEFKDFFDKKVEDFFG